MIYLDHNATTPVDPRVRDAMLPWLEDGFGNPSSSHAAGQEARAAVEAARALVARTLGCAADEVVFTGGGTEADLLALWGSALRRPRSRVVVSAIEHEAVLHAADLLQELGFDVVRVPPERSGAVDAERFAAACNDDTSIASLMLASNETGVVQPVSVVAALLRERGVRFHTDAVQAVGKRGVDMPSLGVDLLSLSAHKFGGPKGVGALVVRRGVELRQLQGGSQEAGRRGGTHAVASIVALGEAIAHLDERLERMPALAELRARLESTLSDRLSGVHVHGVEAERVPQTTLVGFDDLDAGPLLIAADLDGLCLSRGAACASGAEDPSHVLEAMGVPPALALGTVRMSAGIENEPGQIERAADIVCRAVERQRALVS